MTVYRITPAGGYNPCTFGSIAAVVQELKDLLENSEADDTYRVDVVEMSKKDYEELPEHPGY